MAERPAIEIVCCHAEGEVGDVIVGGVEAPSGRTVPDQARSIAGDPAFRGFVLNEPRGGVFRHVNLLVPPVDPKADMGFIIMEPDDVPPMSGSNSICVATVLLETGILPMTAPVTKLVLEAPGGLVDVTAECRDGKVRRVTIRNVASFAVKLDVQLEVAGIGTMPVDIAYGGDSFVIVEASAAGFALRPDEARNIAETGIRISSAATDQLGFAHPGLPELRHISFCLFTTAPVGRTGQKSCRNAVAIRPGKVDRSPTGTGLSARLAVLHAKGEMQVGETLLARSIIDSEFLGRIESVTTVGDSPAIRPTISGRAWVTGTRRLTLDPEDPWPGGYRLSDTWPTPPLT